MNVPRMPIPRFVLVVSVVCLWSTPGFAQDARPDPTRFLRWAYQDVGRLSQQLTTRHAVVGLGIGAVLAPASLFDERLGTYLIDRERPWQQELLSKLNPYGGPRGMRLSAGVFAVTLLTDNVKLQDAAFTSFQSVVYSGALMYALKAVVGRSRPEALAGAHHFAPFSDDNLSFPSGHTSTAFALVTPWVQYYGGPTVVLYGLAAGVGVARITRGKHWFTDVVAGGLLGYGVGRSLSRIHLGEGRAATITPDLRLDGARLTFRLTF